MSGRVEGKVALVTGAGTGIGRAVCVRLAEEGADVVVTSQTPAHVEETGRLAAEASGREQLALQLDVADSEAVDRVVAQVVERFGRIDVLSNNAGIDLVHAPSVVQTTERRMGQALQGQRRWNVLRLPSLHPAHARRLVDREHGLDQLVRGLGE